MSSGPPHVRPMGRACGEPDGIKKNTHPKYITALFRAKAHGVTVTVYGWNSPYWRNHVNAHVQAPSDMVAGGMCNADGKTPRSKQWFDPIDCSDSLYKFKGSVTCDGATVETGYTPDDSCGADAQGQALLKAAEKKCVAAGELANECVEDVCAVGDINASGPTINGTFARVGLSPLISCLSFAFVFSLSFAAESCVCVCVRGCS